MKLFTVPKVPCSLENVTHESELRRGENRVKVAVLHLKLALTRKHAAAMPDGVLRRLYSSQGDDVDPLTLRHDFPSLCDRQILTVAAAPDSPDDTAALDQVRIYAVHAKRSTTENVFTLRFKASFGPLSAAEWGFIDHWRGSQKFVTFKAAQPSLEFLPATDDGDEDDEAAAEAAKAPALPLDGTCSHGARVGQACEECEGGIAVTKPAADGKERARILPHRHQKKATAAKSRTH